MSKFVSPELNGIQVSPASALLKTGVEAGIERARKAEDDQPDHQALTATEESHACLSSVPADSVNILVWQRFYLSRGGSPRIGRFLSAGPRTFELFFLCVADHTGALGSGLE